MRQRRARLGQLILPQTQQGRWELVGLLLELGRNAGLWEVQLG